MGHDYSALVEQLREGAGELGVGEYGRVVEGGREYPLVSIESPPGSQRRLLLTAGFHGEEPAGPLTIAAHLEEILRHAREASVGVTIFPCINPSGFELGTRYNASGEKPNNDFLRYRLPTGELLGELAPGDERALPWEPFEGGPRETRAVRSEIARRPAPDAALDLHQDHYLIGVYTYAYVFGPREPYTRLLDDAALHLPIATRMQVDDVNVTDADGLIRSHDGSVTDFCWRRGTPYTAAVETTTHAPMPACEKTNLVWIHGFIELARRAPERG